VPSAARLRRRSSGEVSGRGHDGLVRARARAQRLGGVAGASTAALRQWWHGCGREEERAAVVARRLGESARETAADEKNMKENEIQPYG
jgi:hypothetical protein